MKCCRILAFIVLFLFIASSVWAEEFPVYVPGLVPGPYWPIYREPVRTLLWHLEEVPFYFDLYLPDEFHVEGIYDQLKAHALDRLAILGLKPADSLLTLPKAQLALNARSSPTEVIGIPGKVLWMPRLELFDVVEIPRNHTKWVGTTWSAHLPLAVRDPVKREDLEQAIDRLLDRFIRAYGFANRDRFEHESMPLALGKIPEEMQECPPFRDDLFIGGFGPDPRLMPREHALLYAPTPELFRWIPACKMKLPPPVEVPMSDAELDYVPPCGKSQRQIRKEMLELTRRYEEHPDMQPPAMKKCTRDEILDMREKRAKTRTGECPPKALECMVVAPPSPLCNDPALWELQDMGNTGPVDPEKAVHSHMTTWCRDTLLSPLELHVICPGGRTCDVAKLRQTYPRCTPELTASKSVVMRCPEQ